MTEERDKLFTARPPPGDGADVYSASTVAGQAPADLLDLVRSAEEAATLATTVKTPSSANKFHAARSPSDPPLEEVVDVSNEAIDAPPSLPPLRAATPAKAFTAEPVFVKEARGAPPANVAPRPAPSGAVEARTLPPALSIAVVLALTIGALVAFVR